MPARCCCPTACPHIRLPRERAARHSSPRCRATPLNQHDEIYLIDLWRTLRREWRQAVAG
ncbi:chain-length determining protein, partial [Xanthomonas perforans]|nr:chain-length determining protein [Xanthomonas perforans]